MRTDFIVIRRAIAMALVASLTALASLRAQTTTATPPAPAASLVAAAITRAQTEKKVVLIEFGASWCVWCGRFQTFIHEPEVAPIVSRNYVVLTLTVQEHTPEKKVLENLGGQEKMDEWGGANSGLPFYVFLDGTGRKIADSNAMPKGANIGFPATPEEITTFVALMGRTAPTFTAADRAVVLKYLKPIPN